jgi:TonB family protein
MNGIYYLLEANLYLAAFYLLYVLLLRSETHYQLNRAYLLISSAVAFIMPMLQMGILKPSTEVSASMGSVSVGSADVSVSVLPAVIQPYRQPLSATDYVWMGYTAIALALLIHLIVKIYRLTRLAKQGTVKYVGDSEVIEVPGQNVAFSFFRYLFVNHELSESATVLHHEEVHIRQKHSLDILYLELLKIINWFNPVVYLMQRSLKEVHEFIADQQTADMEKDTGNYASFLISNAYGMLPDQLTNSFFNKNLLKRRIMMLYKERSGNMARAKYLLALPLMAGLIGLSTMAFTTKSYGWIDIAPRQSDTTKKKAELKDTVKSTMTQYQKGYRDAMMASVQNRIKAEIAIQKSREDLANKYFSPKAMADSAFNASETNPNFPGGFEGFGKFLKENIKYPAEAKAKGVQGRVFVQFIVEKDGSLSNAKILRQPTEDLGQEALRVINLSPKWNPGILHGQAVRVIFTVPVNFALPAGENGAGVRIDAMVLPVTTANPSDSSIYNAVEVNPTFPGNEDGFGKFLRENIRYPAAAKINKVQGRVFVQFVVEKDGTLSNLKVLRAPAPILGDEAMRVLKLSPKWKPGLQNKVPVRVQYTVPINFALDFEAPKDINGLYQYVRNNIRYPQSAKLKNVEGRVFVQFTLDDNKQIQNLKVLRSPTESLGDEVVRVLQNFATLSDGNPKTTYVMPVNFSIYNDKTANSNEEKPTTAAKGAASTNDYKPGTDGRVALNEVVVITYPAPAKQ